MKNKFELITTSIDSAVKTVVDFFKFVDWVILSAIRSIKKTINAIKNFAPLNELKKTTNSLNKLVQHTFPAERALLSFSILFVVAILSNPWLSSSLFEQHFYSFTFKLFSDLIFALSSFGAIANAYSLIVKEYRKFKAKQLKEYHQRLLEREKACRHKPVKNLHSLSAR